MTGFLRGAPIDGVGKQAAALAAEQAAVGSGAVLGDVVAQQPGEHRGNRDRPNLLGSTVLEVAAFTAGAGFVPCASGRWSGLAEVEPSLLTVAVREFATGDTRAVALGRQREPPEPEP